MEKPSNEGAHDDEHLRDATGRSVGETDEDALDVEFEIDDLTLPRLERLAQRRAQQPRWVTRLAPRWTATGLQARRSAPHRLRGLFTGPSSVVLLAVLLLIVVTGVTRPIFDTWIGFGQPSASATWTAVAAFSPVASISPRPQSQDGLACLLDTSWSPDGRLVAVLGTRNDCSLGNVAEPEPGIVNLYRADDGRLTRQLSLDALVAPALSRVSEALATPSPPPTGITVSAVPVPIVAYQFVAWSPDGRGLAIPFAVHREFPGSKGFHDPLAYGLLLLNLPIGNGQVLLAPHSVPESYGQGTWDLASGQFISGDGAGGETWPAALGYQWDGHGQLLPITPLAQGQRPEPLPAGSPHAVGQPIGAATFSVWQPGSLVRADRSNAGIPLTFAFDTYFLAWSPDGRYLTVAGAWGLLVPENQPLPTSDKLRPEAGGSNQSYDVLPIRDAGLAEALRTIKWSASIAWSPDGQLVAIYPWDESAVTLYACSTGKVVTRFSVQRDASGSGSLPHLLWSSDGAQLALMDPLVGPLTRWQVQRT